MRENLFLSLGKYWWNPFLGAKEAVSRKEFSWLYIFLVLVLSHIAKTVIELFSFSVKFSSVGTAFGAIFFVFLSILGVSFLMYALMLSFLVIFYRRVVLPERLLFLLTTSCLPWVFLFPLVLFSLRGGENVATFLSFVASLLSFLWLWELVKREYALSGGKVLVVLFGPLVMIFLAVFSRLISFFLVLTSKGITWWR